MAVAGSAGPGVWMWVQNGELRIGRTETTTIHERSAGAAVVAILAGYRVHVDNYRGLHLIVAANVRDALADGATVDEHGRTHMPRVGKTGVSD